MAALQTHSLGGPRIELFELNHTNDYFFDSNIEPQDEHTTGRPCFQCSHSPRPGRHCCRAPMYPPARTVCDIVWAPGQHRVRWCMFMLFNPVRLGLLRSHTTPTSCRNVGSRAGLWSSTVRNGDQKCRPALFGRLSSGSCLRPEETQGRSKSQDQRQSVHPSRRSPHRGRWTLSPCILFPPGSTRDGRHIAVQRCLHAGRRRGMLSRRDGGFDAVAFGRELRIHGIGRIHGIAAVKQ